MKRGLIILVLVLVITALVVPAYAEGEDWLPDIILDSSLDSTDQFLFTITRPEGDETTIYATYVISGYANDQAITIQLLKQNEDGEYVPFCNTDGESSWEVGAYGIFSKEVSLKEGANKIRVVAYKTDEIDNLELGVNLQVNNFTVTRLNDEIRQIFENGFIFRISEWLGNLSLR